MPPHLGSCSSKSMDWNLAISSPLLEGSNRENIEFPNEIIRPVSRWIYRIIQIVLRRVCKYVRRESVCQFRQRRYIYLPLVISWHAQIIWNEADKNSKLQNWEVTSKPGNVTSIQVTAWLPPVILKPTLHFRLLKKVVQSLFILGCGTGSRKFYRMEYSITHLTIKYQLC